MQQINLLPWRQMQSAAMRKQFLINGLISLIILFVLLVISRTAVSHQLTKQQARNTLLNNEIVLLDNALSEFSNKQMTQASLARRVHLAHELQQQRNNAISLFNLLPEITPQGVMLDKVSQQKGVVSLQGIGKTNADLTEMLLLLEQHEKVQNVQIHSIVNNDKDGVNQFKATFRLRYFVQPNLVEIPS